MTVAAQRRPISAEVIREVARGRWRYTIYPALGIEVGNGKHRACPHCGGKDRFRCDDKDGNGSHFCNQCGAGDGFALVMKVIGCDFPEALRLVAGVLGLDASISSASLRPSLVPKPVPVDRIALAFRFELAALDRRLRAENIIEAANGLDLSSLDDADLDRALGYVAQAHADVDRADLFEHVADALRERDHAERTDRERQTSAA